MEISRLLAESRNLSQTGDHHLPWDINSWDGTRGTPQPEGGASMGGEGRKGPLQQLMGAISRGPREGDMMRGPPGPQKHEGTRVQGVALWARLAALLTLGAGSTLPACTDVP